MVFNKLALSSRSEAPVVQGRYYIFAIDPSADYRAGLVGKTTKYSRI
jgi:hypothetical protein